MECPHFVEPIEDCVYCSHPHYELLDCNKCNAITWHDGLNCVPCQKKGIRSV